MPPAEEPQPSPEEPQPSPGRLPSSAADPQPLNIFAAGTQLSGETSGEGIPVVLLHRRLINARYLALYDRARMEGLYEVTLEANRGLRREVVVETILDSVRRLLRSPAAELAEHARQAVGQRAYRRRLVETGRPRYSLPLVTGEMDLAGLYRLAAALREQGAA